MTPPADPAGAARNVACPSCGWTLVPEPLSLVSVCHNPRCRIQPAPPASEAWPTHPIEGVPVVGANVTEITLGKPASEAGHREDSDEGLVREFENALGREDRILWRGDTEEGEAASESDHQKAKADVDTSKAALLARLRQLRADRSGPGTPSYRLNWLLAELDKRFPGAVHPLSSSDGEHNYLAAIDALRADGERLGNLLAEAAAEINVSGPVAHRIRVLKQEQAEAVQRAREEAAREERERCAKALQPWIDEPGKGMRAGPGVPPSIRMWAKYMQDEIRRQPPGADREGS